MGIGSGVLLIAAGSILFWAIDFDMPYIDDDAMGLILVLAGLAVLVISVIMKVNRPEMGIGTGVFLIAAGAVLTFAIDFDMPYITDYALGWILMLAGLISAGTSGFLAYQRNRRRYGPDPYGQTPYGQAPYGQNPPPGQYQQPYGQYPPQRRP